MKLLKLTLFIIVCAASALAQSASRSAETRPANVPVTDLQIEGKNINKLLAKIAYKYDVPISLEVAADEDLLKGKSLIVQLKKGTLADVLDDIIRQKPSYLWEANEGAIKVFPKSDYRDPLLQTLLDIKIAHFVVRKSTARLNLERPSLTAPNLIIC